MLYEVITTKPAEPKPAETKPAEPKPAPKPAETKPAEPKKQTLPKGFETPAQKAEVPKPKEEAKQLPANFQEALENAYYTAPMTDFHNRITSYNVCYTKLLRFLKIIAANASTIFSGVL